jgi:hypothetical protein
LAADLTAASRHDHLVLYDPAAIRPDVPVDPDLEAQDPNPLTASAIREVASRGEALILHMPGEDCEATLRVFVDEDPPQRVPQRSTVVLSGARLKVPTGKLRADGLEFLSRPGEVRTHSEATETTVPPGEYEVEVGELLSWKLKHRASQTRRGTRSSDRVAHTLVTAYTWLGIILLPANVLIAPMIVAFLWRSRGWRGALTAASVILAIDAVVFGGFWLLQAAQKRFPALTRITRADAAFERDNPDIVIVLRRQPPLATRASAAHAIPAYAQILLDERKRA